MTRLLLFLFACVTASVQAASYYVTQAGAGTHAGTSLGNAWSVANYNATATPTGGDTVFFSGTITSGITPGSSGTGNSTSRLVLDFSGATLNTANPSLNFNGQNYITATGGGSWSGGVYTAAGIIGPLDNRTAITFGNQQSHDITVQGFQSLTTSDTTSGGFMLGQFCYNLLIQDNNLDNISNLFYGDKNSSHDITFLNNYARTNHNQVVQTDVVQIGDAANVTFQGNKFIQRTPGTHASFHNDILQCFRNGGSLASNPTGWVVRYNWIELDVPSGEGDTSWTILENMGDSGGTPALKVYGNVFVGESGTVSDNGLFMGVTAGATVYCYNNTFITRAGRPTNTVRFISSNAADRLYSRNNIGADVITNHGGTALDWTFLAGAPWGYNYFFNWNNPSATYYGSGTGAPQTNPIFVDPSTNNFALQATSPCRLVGDSTIGAEYNQGIATGATWPNPSLVTRSAGVWSIGAYQTAAVVAPLAPNPSTIASTSASPTTITITASTTTGGTGTIQYNHAIDGVYAGLQASPTRTFTGLSPLTSHAFKVKAQDSATPTPNTTTESAVSNVSTTGTVPTVTAAAIPSSGLNIAVTLSASCTTGAGGSGGWTITTTGSAVTVSSVAGSGSSTYTLTTSRPILPSETLKLNYAQPGNGVESTADGVDLASFTLRAVTNNSTYVAPTAPSVASLSIPTGGTTLAIVWNQSASIGAGGSTGFTLVASAGAMTGTYSTGAPGTTTTLTLSRTAVSGETIQLSYTNPGNGFEGTTGGIDVANFSGLTVFNQSTQGIPTTTPTVPPPGSQRGKKKR